MVRLGTDRRSAMPLVLGPGVLDCGAAMTSKAKRLEEQKARYDAMSREDLRDEFVKTLLGSVMPLIETVIERRIYQWFDVISGYEKEGVKPHAAE